MHIIDSDKIMYHGLKGCSEEYKKGYLDAMTAPDRTPTIIEDIKKEGVGEVDVIVWYYDMDKMTYEEVEHVECCLKEQFPNNIVLGLPTMVNMKSCSKEILNNIAKDIMKLIKE